MIANESPQRHPYLSGALLGRGQVDQYDDEKADRYDHGDHSGQTQECTRLGRPKKQDSNHYHEQNRNPAGHRLCSLWLVFSASARRPAGAATACATSSALRQMHSGTSARSHRESVPSIAARIKSVRTAFKDPLDRAVQAQEMMKIICCAQRGGRTAAEGEAEAPATAGPEQMPPQRHALPRAASYFLESVLHRVRRGQPQALRIFLAGISGAQGGRPL
jgi:hypothetical protein